MQDSSGSKKLVVAGTGNPDVVQLVADINGASLQKFDLLGFLDDNPNNVDKHHFGVGVIGGFDWLEGRQDIYVFNSIARSTEIRRNAQERLESFGAQFVSLIHPSVSTNFSEVGIGTLLARNVYLEAKTKVGPHSIVLANTTIAHDSVIGEGCFLGHGCHIQGSVTLEEECFLGAGTTVYPNCVLARRTTLGLNSVLIRNTSEGEVISAAPSRRVK